MSDLATDNKRTILISPSTSRELRDALDEAFTIQTWPPLNIAPPRSFHSLDEALRNLFGYDWLVFISPEAVKAFLDRMIFQQRDVSELDSLGVCAVGDSTSATLEATRQLHVDVISKSFATGGVVSEIAARVGGAEDLRRQNFLIPQALIGREYLAPALEHLDARADVVAAYETVNSMNSLRLVTLRTILLTGGIDALFFSKPAEVEELARVFDSPDLSIVVSASVIACGDDDTLRLVKEFQLSTNVILSEQSPREVAASLAREL